MTYIKLDDAIAAIEGKRYPDSIGHDNETLAYNEGLDDALAALRALPTVSVSDADIERIALQNAKEYLQGVGPWKLDEIGITSDDYLVKCFAKAIREAALGATVSDGWEDMVERNDAMALQVAELEGKYAIVSGMNNTLKDILRGTMDALSQYACHAGPSLLCLNLPHQCAQKCGKVAGDAIVAIEEVLGVNPFGPLPAPPNPLHYGPMHDLQIDPNYTVKTQTVKSFDDEYNASPTWPAPTIEGE